MTDIITCPHCGGTFPLVVVVKEKKEAKRPEKITTTQEQTPAVRAESTPDSGERI